MNETLSSAFDACIDQKDPDFFDILMIKFAMRRPRKRRQLERAITRHAVLVGAIPLTSVEDKVFAGNWLTDMLEYLLTNWETILEIIASIMLFF